MNSAHIFAISSYKISKFFVYAAVVTPLLVLVSMFFPFVAGKAIYFRLVIELALLFFLFYFLGNPREVGRTIRPLLTHPLFVAVTVFIAVYLFTNITGINFYYSFFSNFERGDGGFQLLHVYIFFFLLLFYFPTEKDWIRLLRFSLYISILIALYAIGQKFQNHPGVQDIVRKLQIIGDGGRPPGTLGNPSYLSVYAMIHLQFALFVLYRARTVVSRIMPLVAILLNVYVLVNAQTRGTLLGFAAAIFFALIVLSFVKPTFITWAKRKLFFVSDRRWIFRAGLAGLVIFAGLFLATRDAAIWKKVPVFDRLTQEDILKPFEAASFRSRYLTWTSAFGGFLERPFLGWGAENFPYVFDRYYNPLRFGGESWFDRAHNFVFDYLVAGGIPLLAAYLGIFVVYYQTVVRGARESVAKELLRGPPAIQRPFFLYVVFLAMPVAYLIQNFFLFDVLPIYVALFIFFAFAAHIASGFRLSPDADEAFSAEFSYPRVRLSAVLLVAVFIGTMIVVTGYRPYRKNLLIRESMAIIGSSPFDAMAAFQRAIDYYSPVGQPETIEQLGSGMANIFGALLGAGRGLKPEIAPLTIDFANEVFAYADETRNLISVKPLYLYGVANLQAGLVFRDQKYFQIARSILERGHRLSPTRFEFILGLTDIAIYQKDKELALNMLALARKLRPDLEARYQRYEGALNTF